MPQPIPFPVPRDVRRTICPWCAGQGTRAPLRPPAYGPVPKEVCTWCAGRGYIVRLPDPDPPPRAA